MEATVPGDSAQKQLHMYHHLCFPSIHTSISVDMLAQKLQQSHIQGLEQSEEKQPKSNKHCLK